MANEHTLRFHPNADLRTASKTLTEGVPFDTRRRYIRRIDTPDKSSLFNVMLNVPLQPSLVCLPQAEQSVNNHSNSL